MLYRLIELWYRATAVFRRRRLDRDLNEELTFHLAMREADYRTSGYSSADARSAARRRFGNTARVEEQLRDMWTFPSIESIWHDARHAIRTLRQAPTFTIVAVVTLAFGIGGTTAIYSLGQAASVDALPYHEPERLVQLWGNVQRARTERRGASYPDFVDWRAQATAFEDMALFDGTTATLALDHAERVPVETVSASYFSVLGVRPALGRVFTAQEDTAGAREAVVILSDGLWRRQFGGDTGAIGRQILLESRSFTVIGVMPAGFLGLTDRAQLWIPFVLSQSPEALANRGTRGFVALARLKPGISVERAQSELDTISRRLESAHPDTNEKRAVEVSPLEVELFGDLRQALRALMAAVALVLIMACVNVGNLLLARSEKRQREIAVRAAIGASHTRLLRQLLTESCVLTSLGALAGLVVAHAGIRALVATSPVSLPSFSQPRIDASAALFAIGLAAASGVLLGLAPAAHARVARLSEALKDSARGSDGRRSGRIRSSLIVAEVSLAVVLLVAAGLMIRSAANLADVNPGFNPSSVLTFRVSIPRQEPSASPVVSTSVIVGNHAILERVRAVAGVSAASMATDVPLEGSASAVFYAAEGQGDVTAENRPRAYVHRVTPDFFVTLGIPLVAGRSFIETEIVPDTPVVIVSERLARRFWPGQDAVGKRIKLGDLRSDSPWRSIIGVAGEVKYRGLPENPTADPDIYFPMLAANRQVALVVRTTLPPAAVAAPLRAAIQELNPAVPVYNVTPMEDLVAAQTAQARFTTWLMGIFAALALLLAVVGIYGVMSYLVAQRTREIGIRVTLGADSNEVLRLILGNGARLIAGGLLLGTLGAIGLRRLLATHLFGVGTVDIAAVAAVILLAAAALAACAVPAFRASRIDPVHALRL